MTTRALRATGPIRREAIIILQRIDECLVEKAKKTLHPRERWLFGKVGTARRREWLCARWAIKRAAGGWWPGLRPVEIVTATSPDGPPCARTAGGRTLGVSVAHDGGYVLAAVAKRLTPGIDIQAPDTRCLHLARRFYAPATASVLAATAWWVALEAAAKCTGVALVHLMKTASLLGYGRQRLLAWPGGRVRVEIFPRRGLLVALAWRRRGW